MSACRQTLVPIAAVGCEMRNQDQALADGASDAFYQLSNPRSQIQAFVIDVIQASVAKLNLGDAFERKNEIAKAAEDEVGKVMSTYGYEIVGIPIIGVDSDQRVQPAVLDISIANTKAEAEKIIQMMRAEGEDEFKKSMPDFSENVQGTTAKDVLVQLYVM